MGRSNGMSFYKLHKTLQKSAMELTRKNIIKLINSSIQSGNEVTDEDISDQLKMSLDEVRFHLDELERGSFVKLVRNRTYCTNGEVLKPIEVTPRGKMLLQGKIPFEDGLNSHPNSQVFKITNHAPVATQQFGNYNTLNVNQKSNLTEAAAEIQQLLSQLEQSYPTETFVQKATVVDEALKQIEGDPSFKGRVIGALKSAGKEALKEAIDHPLVNIFIAAVEGWQEGL